MCAPSRAPFDELAIVGYARAEQGECLPWRVDTALLARFSATTI
jgi:hypothetical protein